ncbi:toprim domain-containing protein [Methylobacterium durans]
MRLQENGVAVSCWSCGDGVTAAEAAGVPSDLIVPRAVDSWNVTLAEAMWKRAVSAKGTLVEEYVRYRGFTGTIPPSIRCLPHFLAEADGRTYTAMIALVQRGGGCADTAGRQLHHLGVHLTPLAGPDSQGRVLKASIKRHNSFIGQILEGGVWLHAVYEAMSELVVAESIEAALSVRQFTSLPTVSALSPSGLQAFRWPQTVQRMWIAADNDSGGLRAAANLRARALRAGVDARIGLPVRNHGDPSGHVASF